MNLVDTKDWNGRWTCPWCGEHVVNSTCATHGHAPVICQVGGIKLVVFYQPKKIVFIKNTFVPGDSKIFILDENDSFLAEELNGAPPRRRPIVEDALRTDCIDSRFARAFPIC